MIENAPRTLQLPCVLLKRQVSFLHHARRKSSISIDSWQGGWTEVKKNQCNYDKKKGSLCLHTPMFGNDYWSSFARWNILHLIKLTLDLPQPAGRRVSDSMRMMTVKSRCEGERQKIRSEKRTLRDNQWLKYVTVTFSFSCDTSYVIREKVKTWHGLYGLVCIAHRLSTPFVHKWTTLLVDPIVHSTHIGW